MTELSELTATEAAGVIRNGDVSAEALVACLIGRAEKYRHLNAFISFDADRAREAAHDADRLRSRGGPLGRLHGVPLSLKDNIDTAAFPTTAATPALRNNRPSADAPIAAALRDAGAIILGKNTMHELAFGITCNNPAFGASRNPYNPVMIPGGSSGGTGVAVAARLSAAGIGSDTGGSVRVPSALCGVAGLRPTLKRWSQKGIVPIAATRDTAGPLARAVADLALLDSVVTGSKAGAPVALSGLRLGIPRHYFWDNLDDDTARLCEGVLARLRSEGAELVEADLAGIGSLNESVSFVIALYESRRDLTAYLSEAGGGLKFEELVAGVSSPDVRATLESMLKTDTQVPHDLYLHARDHHRPRLIAAYTEYFATHQVNAIVFPTTPLVARPIGEDDTVDYKGSRLPTFPTFIRNTDPGSNAGIPGISLPVGLSADGLPVGIALDGPPGSDQRLLAIAAAIESVLPKMPPPPL